MSAIDYGLPADLEMNKPKKSHLGWFKYLGGYAVLLFFAMVYLYPFVIQLSNSFKTDAQAAQDPLTLKPDPFSTAAWEKLLGGSVPFDVWMKNSIIVALFVTFGRVFFDSMAGYALSRLHFRGRDSLSFAIVAMMAVPGVVLLIPKFLVLKGLGIWDTYPAMILPLIIDASGIFIMKQFFESVSPSMEEAARIDGAGVFRTFWSVVLPMAKPALITLTILSFQGSWNEFTHFLVATQSPSLNTLTKGVAQLTTGQLGGGQMFPLKLAAAFIATIPTAIVFIIFQRRFVQGANEGADKG